MKRTKRKVALPLEPSLGDDEVFRALERIRVDDAIVEVRACLGTSLWEAFAPTNRIALERTNSAFRASFERLGPVRTVGEEASIGNDALEDQGVEGLPTPCVGHHWGGEIVLLSSPSSPAILAMYQPGPTVEYAPSLEHLILRIDWELRGELNERVRGLTR